MDPFEAVSLSLRFTFLSILSIICAFNTKYYYLLNKQIKKIDLLLDSYGDPFDADIQSSESSACSLVEGPFQDDKCDEEQFEPIGDGEVTEISQSGNTVESKPDEPENKS